MKFRIVPASVTTLITPSAAFVIEATLEVFGAILIDCSSLQEIFLFSILASLTVCKSNPSSDIAPIRPQKSFL